MSSKKKDQRIPVHVVDYHNDALRFILRLIGSKKLKFDDNLLIHMDSHPDLSVEDNLNRKHVFDPDVLFEKVNIETWILPLVFAGHVNEIVWIKPNWSNQIDDGTYEFYVGETEEDGIKISGPLLYFISGLGYAPYENLIDAKKVTIIVMTWFSSKDDVISSQSHVMKLIEKHDQSYILDIDLDFFYTINPFIDMYEKVNMYENLKFIYKFTNKELSTFPSAQEAQLKRRKFIKEVENLFIRLDEEQTNNFPAICNLEEKLIDIDDEEKANRLKTLIEELYKVYANRVDWVIVHNAGTTIDDEDRAPPHHPSTNDEIDQYICYLKDFLTGISKPKIITIARSSSDDYCPSHIADMLQERVLKVVKDSFAELNVQIYSEES